MGMPDVIEELVVRFGENRSAYKSGGYNETQVRREFIDPFFEALGWDVTNKAGHAEAYKDVVHEDAIRVGGTTKAPDYCFRIGGTRKFFVEAKKPSVNVKSDPHPAYQVRRYAWSAKLPISIVTDFEELAVYDCRTRPKQSDKSSTERILYLTYDKYADRWSELEQIFSKTAILKGAFDRYHEDAKGKRGTETVDVAFLNELDRWRKDLARNLALRNPSLSVRDLNESVQRIIDRVVFLRICEDRGIEDYGRLRTVTEATDCYRGLCALFERADDKYNSGLFHFKEETNRASATDRLTPNLMLDDRVVKEMVGNLYYPESPYEFSVLPADILGKVYEEFLGKTIRLTDSGRAKIEEKPEVRKAGGVYYTPQYIVEHLVDNTLGTLLAKATPERVRRLRILDPACGSGSFLLVAYQRLLDWYHAWYVSQGPEKHAKGRKPALFRGSRGQWHLTVAKRKEILTDNIYGVDIDEQAVEVSKLSLLLKVLEGEVESLPNRVLFEERALPDLGNNIVCGNSLVGFDFLKNLPTEILSSTSVDIEKINSFDWEAEFPEVFAAGGFDVVVGNPPYLSYAGRQKVDISPAVQKYYERVYKCAGWPTSHSFFIEQSVSKLSRRFVAFIVPDQVGHLAGYRSLREVLLAKTRLVEVRYWGENVFKNVTTPALTFVTDSTSKNATSVVEKDGATSSGTFASGDSWFFSPQKDLLDRLRTNSFSVRAYIADCGIRTTAAKQQVVLLADARDQDLPALEGKRVGRYWCSAPTIAVRMDRGAVFRSGDEKYDAAEFLIRQTAAYPIVGPHRHARYFRNSVHALKRPEAPMDIRYLVGLFNSKLLRFAYVAATREAGQRAFPQVKLGALAALPFRSIDFSKPSERQRHDSIVELVTALLVLQEELERAADERTATGIRRRVETLDARLDDAVYELYSLDVSGQRIVDETLEALPSPPNFPADQESPKGLSKTKSRVRRAKKKSA